MDNLNTLDAYLEVDYDENMWSDFAILYATELVNKLSDDEWTKIINISKMRSTDWQKRLASALCGSLDSRIIPFLCSLLHSDNVSVAQAAIETLETRDDIFFPDASMRPLLLELRAKLPEGERVIADMLIARIR